MIVYGDFAGADAVFKAVTESTAVPGDTVLLNGFGPPVVSGNSLVFTPTSFAAFSAGGGAPDFSDSHLTMTIAAVANQVIQHVAFNESGVYTLVGPGTALTKAEVAIPGFLTITKISAPGPFTAFTIAGNLTFAPAGSFALPADEGTGVSWIGKLSFDVTQALRDHGIQEGFATEVVLSLNNSLLARSESGTIAYIDKKTAQVVVDPEPVPEPGTLVLLGVGVVGLAGFGWRRRKCLQNAA